MSPTFEKEHMGHSFEEHHPHDANNQRRIINQFLHSLLDRTVTVLKSDGTQAQALACSVKATRESLGLIVSLAPITSATKKDMLEVDYDQIVFPDANFAS